MVGECEFRLLERVGEADGRAFHAAVHGLDAAGEADELGQLAAVDGVVAL